MAPLTLAATLVVVLVRFGGGNHLTTTRCWGIAGGALFLACLAATLRRRMRHPDLWPVVAVTAVPLLVGLIQCLPMGWHHPWLEADVQALGLTRALLSFDHQATLRAMGFAGLWGAVAVTVAILARHERLPTAAKWVAGLAATHAGLAFLLLAIPSPWGDAPSGIRLSGTFIYPNHAAAFWGAALPLAIVVARQAATWRWWLAVGILAAALLMSGSRAGIAVALVVNLPLVWTLLPHRRRLAWASGTAMILGLWIWLLGSGLVAKRFTELVDEQGSLTTTAETLNGRMQMWMATIPLAMNAGPWGTGLGTTEQVYPRNGTPAFADLLVDHVHSDPLEWWLETGWAGTLALFAASGWALWRVMRAPCTDRLRRRLRLGAMLGIGHVALHSLTDFPWHNESVALLTATLVGLAVAAREQTEAQPARATWPLRSAVATGALALGLAATVLWPWAAADERAIAGTEYLYQRLEKQLPAAAGTLVVAARTTTPITVRSAVFSARCELALAAPTLAVEDRQRATTALAIAAELSPGNPAAWIERARLEAGAGAAGSQAPAYLVRSLAAAPADPYVLHQALHLSEVLPEAMGPVIARVVASGQPLPEELWRRAAALAGKGLAQQVAARGEPRQCRSALPWLSTDADLTDWQTAVQTAYRQRPPRVGPDRLFVWQTALGPESAVQLDLPDQADARSEAAQRLLWVGLPIPESLVLALRADGLPWSLALVEPVLPEAVGLAIEADLWRPWARRWWEQRNLAERIRGGDEGVFTSALDPRLLLEIAADPKHPLQSRAVIACQRRGRAIWQDFSGGGTCFIIAGQPGSRAVYNWPSWCLVVIDGVAHGWQRGRIDATLDLAPGPHKITVLPF